MDIGKAVEAAIEGKPIGRPSWNGKGMFVYYVPAGTYPPVSNVAKIYFGGHVNYNPYLAIKNVDNSVSTWVPSINDLLAKDWEVIDIMVQKENSARMFPIYGSEIINFVGYENNFLYIGFKNGDTYRYPNVPIICFYELKSAVKPDDYMLTDISHFKKEKV